MHSLVLILQIGFVSLPQLSLQIYDEARLIEGRHKTTLVAGLNVTAAVAV